MSSSAGFNKSTYCDHFIRTDDESVDFDALAISSLMARSVGGIE
jgi:hypothetical protein